MRCSGFYLLAPSSLFSAPAHFLSYVSRNTILLYTTKKKKINRDRR